MLAGEKVLNAGLLHINQTDDDSGYCDGWDWDHVRWGRYPPEPDWFDPNPGVAHASNSERHGTFGSAHAGGFNSVLCDGSVRSIKYEVDLATFELVSRRNDDKKYSPDDL
jgi:prepilin-type processing-associated H-X9-DG protein